VLSEIIEIMYLKSHMFSIVVVIHFLVFVQLHSCDKCAALQRLVVGQHFDRCKSAVCLAIVRREASSYHNIEVRERNLVHIRLDLLL